MLVPRTRCPTWPRALILRRPQGLLGAPASLACVRRTHFSQSSVNNDCPRKSFACRRAICTVAGPVGKRSPVSVNHSWQRPQHHTNKLSVCRNLRPCPTALWRRMPAFKRRWLHWAHSAGSLLSGKTSRRSSFLGTWRSLKSMPPGLLALPLSCSTCLAII